MTWLPLTRESAKETQAELERIIGLTRRTFRASAFLKQGDAANFADASPADKKAYVGEMLDPAGFWPAITVWVREKAKTAEQEIAVARAQVVEREERLAGLTVIEESVLALDWQENQAAAALFSAETALEQARQAQADNQAAAERVNTLTARYDAARNDHERIAREHETAAGAKTSLDDALQRLEAASRTADRLPELERRAAEHAEAKERARVAADRKKQAGEESARLAADAHRIHTDLLTASRALGDLTEKRTHLLEAEDGHERCDRCRQTLGAEARAAAISSLAGEIDDAEKKIAALTAEHEDAEKASLEARRAADAIAVPVLADDDTADELKRAREASEQKAALTERVKALELTASGLTDLEEQLSRSRAAGELVARELDEARAKAQDQITLDVAAGRAQQTVATAREAREQITNDLARARLQVEQLHAAQEETRALTATVAARQADLDLLRLAERAFGRDGIPILLVEAVIPVIEAETNRLLELMPTADGVTLRVQLVTQKAQKTVEHLKETLDIVVSDLDGSRPYETFSGGERSRLNVCLRVALAVLLADRRGAESRILCIDELEFLDELGQASLIEVVRSVAGRFDRVIVVSHSPNVRDAFDSVLEIVKDGGVSRVVGAGSLLEEIAVAA